MFRPHDYTYAEIHDLLNKIDSRLLQLKILADDMYVVLTNEMGSSSVTKAYEEFLKNEQNQL